MLNLIGDEILYLMKKSDILITDYSSLWSDYLIFKRPIVFTQFDRDNYLKERSFYNYESKLPGEKVKSWSELIDVLENIMINKNDLFIKKRLDFYTYIYKYNDSLSCRRLCNF